MTGIAKSVAVKPEPGILVKQHSYTSGQVARVFDVAPRTVTKWADKGQIDHYRIPGSQDRRFTFESIIKFARRNNMPVTVQGAGNRILIISANGELVEQFRIELAIRNGQLGCQFDCYQVSNWLVAGKQIAGLLYDAVVIDAAMGRETALYACADIKQVHPSAPVIVLTYEDETNQRELISHGASLVIRQPFSVKALVAELIDPGE